jgi:hypothetical protein
MKSWYWLVATAFPGCARLTRCLDTGWKACATDLKNFSEQPHMILRLSQKNEKMRRAGIPPAGGA